MTSSFMFSLRHCKDIANMLFWACLDMHTNSNTINLQKTFSLSVDKKPTSSPTLFWRYCTDNKLLILGTLAMSGNGHSK